MITIVIPSPGTYSDFVAAVDALAVKGDVWNATTVNSTFQAQFISRTLDVSVTFASATEPPTFSTDFPSARQFNSGFTLSLTHGDIIAVAQDYSDFKFIVDYLGANGLVFVGIDSAQGSSNVSIYALNKQLNAQVLYSEPGSSLPPSFATDFPSAVSMSVLSRIAITF